MLEAVDGDTEKARRDRAILRLLFDLALRREEVAALDVQDLDLEAGTIAVMGKGRTQKVSLTLPPETVEAIQAWLEVRGVDPGPLFVSLHRGRKGITRLTGTSIYRMIRSLGDQVGIKARPHGLRHAAITAALDLTDGNVRMVQRFSRHRDIKVLMVYDDNLADMGGKCAKLVAAGV